MDETEIKLVSDKPCRGNHPVSIMQGSSVLFAGQVNPFKAEEIDSFLKQAIKAVPALKEQKAELRSELLQLAAPKPQAQAPAAPAMDCHDPEKLLAETPADIRAEADALAYNPALIQHIVDNIEALGVAGERMLSTTIYIVGTSRERPKPLSGRVQGPSSSGKSFIVETVADLFPPESVIHATQMTPQALIHMPAGSLSHRWIVAGERSRLENDESAEATRALREMLASGKLSKLMPAKINGEIVTQHIEQAGPIAYVETTTLTKIFDEDANRSLLLTTDERPEQTRRIISNIAAQHCGSLTVNRQRIVAVHQCFQRMLVQFRGCKIVIPFLQQLADQFPDSRPEARRAFGHVVSMIEAVTLLHAFQREQNTEGALIASQADYEIGRRLLAKPLARLLGRAVSDGAKRLFARLPTYVSGRFASTDVYRREDFSDTQLRGWLRELVDGGCVKVVEASRGKPTIYDLSNDPPDLEAVSFLPELNEDAGDATSPLRAEVKV